VINVIWFSENKQRAFPHSIKTDAFLFTFCNRRWRNHIREVDFGENNQGYDDRDLNLNSEAGTEEVQLVTVRFHCKVGKISIRARLDGLSGQCLGLCPIIPQGGERHSDRIVSCLRTQYDYPGQDLDPDHYI